MINLVQPKNKDTSINPKQGSQQQTAKCMQARKGHSTGTSKARLPLVLCQQHLLPCQCLLMKQQAPHCHSCCHRIIHAGMQLHILLSNIKVITAHM